jgi:hypothetical protein
VQAGEDDDISKKEEEKGTHSGKDCSSALPGQGLASELARSNVSEFGSDSLSPGTILRRARNASLSAKACLTLSVA